MKPASRPTRWRPAAAALCVGLLACLGVAPAPAGQVADPINDRAAQALAAEPAQPERVHPKFRAFEVLRRTAVSGCAAAADAVSLAEPTARHPDDPAESAGTELFALPALVRLLLQFPQCIDEPMAQAMQRALAAPQDRLAHGTLNHAIMRVASWYLIAQRFPQATWPDARGERRSSQELMAAIQQLLQRRTAQFFAAGHTEWLSPTYAVVNLLPLLNLIDFADDAQVRANAQAQAALLVAVLRAASFHGTLLPPLNRLNHDQRNAPGDGTDTPAATQALLWLYFGEPASGSADLANRNEPAFVTIAALSRWRPPAALFDPAGRGGHAVRMRTPAFSRWDDATTTELLGDGYIDEAYALGTGNVVFRPNTYADHLQSFALLLKSSSRHNAIECRHPFFRSDAGDGVWGTDRWSPFQQTHRIDGRTGVMLFRIPRADPWPGDPASRFFAPRSRHAEALVAGFQCRVPRSFARVQIEPHWIFVRQGEVDVAIGLPVGRFEIDASADPPWHHVARVQARSAALVFLVRKTARGDSFRAFQAWARQRMPKFDPATTRVVHTTLEGRRVAVQFDLQSLPDGRVASIPRVEVDGKSAPPPPQAPLLSDPVTLADGVLRLVRADGRSVYIQPPSATAHP
ncbi:MAG: hypothetical protein ACK4PH_12230 [Aquincola tertiaricarbonis]